MATRAEVERLASANRKVSKMVQGQLAAFFWSLDLNKPEVARDALLGFVPSLTRQFGDVASVVAMEWYEEVRATAGKSSVRTVAAPPSIPRAAVEAKVRYSAGGLWTPTPSDTLAGLQGAADKYVKQPGRDTIVWNAERNGSGWARVPSGPETCSFCMMMCSRDSSYTSRDSALFARNGDRFHGDCDCVAIEKSSDDDYPEGFHPSEAFQMYEISREKSGSGDIDDILFDMRRRFPDRLKDGVLDPDYMALVG